MVDWTSVLRAQAIALSADVAPVVTGIGRARVHSDAERGIIATECANRLGEWWIKITTTQGNDSAANGLAENTIGQISRAARSSLAHINDANTRRAPA